MKKGFLLLGLFLLLGCKIQSLTNTTQDKTEATNVAPYKTSSETISKTLAYLSSDELEGRNTGTEGIEKAAVYLEKILQDNNIKPYFDSYRDSFEFSDYPAFNIVGYLEGTHPTLKNEFVIIGAHYDHIGIIGSDSEDKIANGANDNASGVTVVTEIAKYLSKQKLDRSVLIVFFSAEESGLVGSRYLSKKLKNQRLNLYTMLNFEMVGVPMQGEYLSYITGYDLSNMADKINEYGNDEYLVKFLPKSKQFGLFYASDNAPFYSEFKVPAQTVCTFDFENFNYYHHVNDEFDQMDINHITNFTNKFIPVVHRMINAPEGDIKLK